MPNLNKIEESLDFVEAVLLVCAYLPDNADIQKEENILLTEAYTRLREMRDRDKAM